MIYNYYNLLIFALAIVFISLFIVSLNDLFIEKDYDTEKNSAYECGFQPIDLNFDQFDIKFYIVGLLFLIFDVEIIFIIPFINVSFFLNFVMISNFLFFFFCFYITFIYEWKNKYLEWK